MGAEHGNGSKATVSKVETSVAPVSEEDLARARRAGKALEKQLVRLEREKNSVNWQELLNREVTI